MSERSDTMPSASDTLVEQTALADGEIAEAAPVSLSLQRNFIWTFLGNGVYAAAQWGMLVVLARLGTPEIVGQFALALAVTAPIMLLSNLQLRTVQATDARHEYTFGTYFGLRLVMTGAACLVIAGVALLGDRLFAQYRAETALVIVLVGLAKGVESLSDIFFGLLQQHERMDRIARSMIGKGVLSLAALGIAVWLTGTMVWGALALLLAWLLVLLVYDVPSGRWLLRQTQPDARIAPQFNPRDLWTLTRLALPLGFVMMLISLNTNIPRYAIQSGYGEYEVGIFSALAYLIVAGTTVVNALGQSATPRLARHYAAGDLPGFRRLLVRLLGIGVCMAVGGVLVAVVGGQPLLTLIYGREYSQRLDVFILLMVAGGVGYVASFLGYGMTAARFFGVQFYLFGVIALVTAAGSAVWVPAYGIVGAAWALILASVVQLIGSIAINAVALRRLHVNAGQVVAR